MLKSWGKFDWKGAVESTFGGLESAVKGENGGGGGGSGEVAALRGQLQAYQELLVDAQFGQLVLFREQQAQFADRDQEIERLKKRNSSASLYDDDDDGENESKLSNHDSSGSKGGGGLGGKAHGEGWVADWEKRMKANILDKVEALAQARESEETARALARQLDYLKEMLRAQDRKAVHSERLDALLREADHNKEGGKGKEEGEGPGSAEEALALDFAELSLQFETQRQQLCDANRDKAKLEQEMERQTTHIELLMSSSPSTAASAASGAEQWADDARLLKERLSVAFVERERLEADLADERQRCLELSKARSAAAARGGGGRAAEELEALGAKLAGTAAALAAAEEREAELRQQVAEEQRAAGAAASAAAEAADAHAVEVAALREEATALRATGEAARAQAEEATAQLGAAQADHAAAAAAAAAAAQEQAGLLEAVGAERDELLVAMAESAAEHSAALAAQETAAVAAQEAAVEAQRASMQADVDEHRRLYLKESALRKRVHNELMDLKGNIRVYCRVRPVLAFEKKRNGADLAADVTSYPVSNEIVLAKDEASSNRFEFDSVFAPATTQEEVFEDISPLITSVLDGYNVCIFAYGQTGSGKTHTMEGTGADPGVNFRALDALFSIRDDRRADEAYTFTVSVLEIYNESVRDLLMSKQDRAKADKSAKAGGLDLRLGSDGKVFVQGLETVAVECMADVKAAMRRAQSNRAVGSHSMNEHSSRSHLVLTISVAATNKLSGAKSSGSLNLIDLAGSERVGKTDATGDRLKEAQAINKSLSALGDVISALGQPQTKGSHVPFRNSKLTHLLQNSLAGDSKVAMFVNISPIKYNASESVTSLQFAQRCRKVELGSAKKNGDSKELAKYKRMVDDLQAQLGSQSRFNNATPIKRKASGLKDKE